MSFFNFFRKSTPATTTATVDLKGINTFGDTIAILAYALQPSEIQWAARNGSIDTRTWDRVTSTRITKCYDHNGHYMCAVAITFADGSEKTYGVGYSEGQRQVKLCNAHSTIWGE